MFKRVKQLFILLITLYTIAMGFFYFNQDKFFFNPKKLASSYQYKFDSKFEEINIAVDNKNTLNTLLFKSENSKGVILYLHGNAGALHDWGLRANLYTDNNYDILFVDYRGFGKNKNEIKNEKMLHSDMQQVYNFLKTRYKESDIIVLGFSIGSGLATKIAANNNPKLLILEAPYYSFTSLVRKVAPLVPPFLISYKIPTHQFIQQVKCPIIIFHGRNDQLITPEGNSNKLKQLIPNNVDLYLIDNCNHNGIYRSEHYRQKITGILNQFN